MMRSILIIAVSALALGGCAGNKKATKPEIERGPEMVVAPPPQPQAAETGIAPVAEVNVDPFEDPSNPLNQRVIYFDYNSSAVKDLDVANAHAQYLADHPTAKVRLEGHADERGTREYNIALSERRAMAVKELMMFRGVRPNQVTVIAYGEERPVAFGHDKNSWAANRRVEIVYEAK